MHVWGFQGGIQVEAQLLARAPVLGCLTPLTTTMATSMALHALEDHLDELVTWAEEVAHLSQKLSCPHWNLRNSLWKPWPGFPQSWVVIPVPPGRGRVENTNSVLLLERAFRLQSP